MRSSLLTTLAAAAGLAASGAAFAQTSVVPPPPGYPATTGSIASDAPGAPAPRYETDGNANMPRAMNAPGAPNYTQGSGQQTGGPARELIPR